MIRPLAWLGLTAAIVLSLSCSGEADPFAPPGIRPVVTGITLRDENGEVFGRWRNPRDGGVAAFPNPFFPSTALRFENPVEGTVRIDVVAMDLPGEGGPAARPILGLAMPQARDPALVTTIFDGQMAAGEHQLTWRGVDGSGSRVPSGFYRLRVVREDAVLFDDVYLFDPERGPPPPPDLLALLQF